MNKNNLLPADTFIVVNKTILNDADRLLLTMLYQPIIGSVAINLYFTLWSYLDSKEIISTEWTHHHMLATMRVSLENIKTVREKLEGIGLLKTYVQQNNVNNYIYEMYSPLTAYEFLSNPILSISLYNNVGEIEYERIKNYYTLPTISLKGYEDITSTFSDVFETVTSSPIEVLSNDIKRHHYRNLELISKLNVDEVLSKIPEEMLNSRSITNETKNLIYKLSFIYNLNETNTAEIILNSINEQRRIDAELLQANCRNYFQYENNGKLPSLAFKSQPEHLRKQLNGTNKRDKMVYIFETTKPALFLASKNNMNTITKQDKEILSYLLIELNLNPGVVNVLIDYVLRINNNKLIKNFIEVIAVQWKRSNIETVEQAMNLAEKEYKTRKTVGQHKKRRQPKEDTVPDWFDKEIESTKVDEQSLKKLEAMLEEYK